MIVGQLRGALPGGGARGPDSWARSEDTLQDLTVLAAAEHINNEAGMQTGSTSRASGMHAKSMLRGSDELTEAEHTSEVTGAQLDGTSDANSLGADLMGAEPVSEATGKLPHNVLDASSRVTANLVAVNKDHTETLHAECGWEVGNAQSEHIQEAVEPSTLECNSDHLCGGLQMEAAIAAPNIEMMDTETLHAEGGRAADSVQRKHTKETGRAADLRSAIRRMRLRSSRQTRPPRPRAEVSSPTWRARAAKRRWGRRPRSASWASFEAASKRRRARPRPTPTQGGPRSKAAPCGGRLSAARW